VSESGPTVLVIDDDEDFVDAQADLLRSEYAVRTAYGGESGVEAFDETVDVVVLDREMPDLHGDEVAQQLQQQNGNAQILMTTGIDPDVDIIELGIDDYVTKPIHGTEMLDHVEEALERMEYNDTLQGYFSLANKRDVMADDPELRETEKFSELRSVVDQMAREHIELREEQFQTLVEHSPVAIVTLDEEGLVDIWNPAASELFGWEAEEALGEEPPMFAGESNGELKYARTQLFQDTIVSDLDVSCRRKNGSAVDVSLSAAPLTADSEMYGTLFVFLDVTERKQRAQQVTVMNRVLRHNVRNELNLLMGWLTELDRDLEGEQAEYVENALTAAREIDSMAKKARRIQDTLAADRDVEEKNIVRITELQLERAQEEYGNLEIQNDLPSEAPVIAISRIREAIWEVIENALEHHDGSPRIRVRLDLVKETDGLRRQLTIEDDGPGLPDEERDVLFEGTEEELRHGSGLGLWYVKWLLDRSDAILRFTESQFETGTAVQLRFRMPGESR
jgi:PAS domain S-box-containing protein